MEPWFKRAGILKNNCWPEGDTTVKGQMVKLQKATDASPPDHFQ